MTDSPATPRPDDEPESPAAGAAVPAPRAPGDGLSASERAVLDFEERWWRNPGAKDQAIGDELGMSRTRYYQVLAGLLDNPAALAEHPALIRRLARVRDARRRARTAQ